MADRAKLDTRFLQLGIHPGGGHTWMLRRIAGPQAAMAAVVFGQVLDGAEAERIGLAYKCVPSESLLEVAHEFAAVAASAPRALAIEAKQTIQDMADIDNHPDAVAARTRPAALEHAATVVRRTARRGQAAHHEQVSRCADPVR